jgi:hypothetical protein
MHRYLCCQHADSRPAQAGDDEEVNGMINGKHIGAPSPLFVRRVGDRLREVRVSNRRPLWYVARKSGGRFSTATLRDAEAGLLPLDAATVADLAAAYGVDVTHLLPNRSEGVVIDPAGTISAAGRSVPFDPSDPTSVVASYFTLVRTLRSLSESEPLTLRKNDVSVIAQFLGEHSERSQLLEALVAVADAQRKVTVSSLLVGAASAGLIDLPTTSAVHRTAVEHSAEQHGTPMYFPDESPAPL